MTRGTSRLLMLAVLAAASLASAGAMAQANDPKFTGEQSVANPRPEYGPRPGSPESYNNSGSNVEPGYSGRGGLFPYLFDERSRAYSQQDARRDGRRDRDGDGVRDSRDRYPDDRRYQ